MEINEKNLKGILKEQREEYQRYVDSTVKKQGKEFQHYVGAIKEGFDSKIEVIAEQYTDIKDTLAEHGKILAEHSQILNSHTEMIASIQETIEIMKTDVEFIKGSLRKKVDLEEFEALERRVSILETKRQVL